MATAAPQIVIPRMSRRPSGLWSPSSQLASPSLDSLPDNAFVVIGDAPSDVDAFWVAPSPEALGLGPVNLESVEGLVATLPFEPAMMALSAISGCVWFAGMDQAKHLALAEEVYGTGRPVLQRLRAFAAEHKQHLLFSEQHLTAVMRLLVCSDAPSTGLRDMTDSEVDALLMAIVGIGSYQLGDHLADTSGGPNEWVPWLVRSGLYFDRTNLGSDQGRAHALFVSLLREADCEGHNWCDLAGWMQEDLASFADQLAFAYAVGAYSQALEEEATLRQRFRLIDPDGLLADQLASEKVERLVGAASASRQELAETFASAGQTEDHIMWDRAQFEQRPFLRLEDGRLLLTSPRFLHAWMGEGFYYRLLDSAKRRRETGSGPSSSLRFTRFHGELIERYVVRLTIESHRVQTRAGVVRITGEQVYIGRDGTESKSPDVVLSYATDVVAVEVTGGRPPRQARVLTDPSLMLDFIDDRLIGKMQELDRAIRDLLDRLVAIDGVDPARVQRVWPVIVVPSTILQTDLLWTHIETHAPQLFGGPKVQAPTLLSIEDYEHALGVVEQGQGLPWLLAQRFAGLYRRMPPSHFFQQRFRNLQRPSFLDVEMRAAGERAHQQLFGGRKQGAEESSEISQSSSLSPTA